MVKFNPRDKGNKPGIAIMIAVKKPKKGEKVEKNDEAAYYDDEVPMAIAWQLLKEAGMDGLDEDGNYPEKPPNVPQYAFRNDSAPTGGFPEKRFYKPPNTEWGKIRREAKPKVKEEILANQGFTPQAIEAANRANDVSRAALNNNRRLFQPKGG